MNKSSRFLCSGRGGFAAVTAVAALGLGLLSLAFGAHVAPGRASESGVGPEPAAVFAISALGRIEPSAGVIRIAGPSRPGAVVADLRVEAGDRVDAGQLIAVLDDHDELTALVKRLSAEQRDAAHRRRRFHHLHRDGIISTAEREAIDLEAAVKEAELDRARAQLATSLVRAPGGGTVLDIVARRGERVGPEGIAILADTARMDVIAEVYETDVGSLTVGRSATITSPALAAPLHGQVSRIGRMVGKQRVFDTDPFTATDRRVVEVRIRLDAPEQVTSFTNLQVEVAFDPPAAA